MLFPRSWSVVNVVVAAVHVRSDVYGRSPLSAAQCDEAGISFYPRDAMLARVFATATCLSVRPSGRPSVTRRYCA